MADETVFICYRRDDSSETAGRIFDRLSRELPEGAVFRDLDSIPLGVDFREHVRRKLAVARVVLVLIGPDWLTISDAQERRRLDDAADHVRVEIELALGARNVRVIPILCRHAEMPGAYDLPESIRDLAFKNGQAVRPDPDFHRDVDHLREQIKRIIAENPRKAERKSKAPVAKPAPPAAPPAASAPVPDPAPTPVPAKSEVAWKKIVQNIFVIALFLTFWGAILSGVWTGGRYVFGKVTDYFHKPTPDPHFPSTRQLVNPSPTGAGTLDWKGLTPGGSQSRLLTMPTPTPTPTPTPAPALGAKSFPGLGRRDPATELFFPNLLKTPTPTPTPSLNERVKKILGNEPSTAPVPEKR